MTPDCQRWVVSATGVLVVAFAMLGCEPPDEIAEMRREARRLEARIADMRVEYDAARDELAMLGELDPEKQAADGAELAVQLDAIRAERVASEQEVVRMEQELELMKVTPMP